MFISVIICTYNPNENSLARTIESIRGQDLNPEEWELFVVDNNSSDPVGEREIVREHNVRVVFEGRQGLSAARECGVKHSRGDVLVFVDDDNVLAPDYLRTVKSIFATPNIGIVSGSIAPEYEKVPPGWFKKFETMIAIRRPLGERPYLTNIPAYNEFFPIGAGMCVRRMVIEDYYQAIASGSAYISGRTGKELSSAEDIDLDFFAISQGLLIGTVGALKLVHIIPAFRTTPDYISRLMTASINSAIEVNNKWKHVFSDDVYDYLRTPKRRIRFRLLASACLYWLPKQRIMFNFYKTLAKHLSSQA